MYQLPKFQNPALLRQALTHRSLPNHNERLEFLGDAILQAVITPMLYQRFPKDNEGVLTQKRSSQVSNQTLAKIARKLKLGKQLYMNANAEKQGCRQKTKVLSDTLEAIIGAYFLDSGSNFTKVEWYIRQLFQAFESKC